MSGIRADLCVVGGGPAGAGLALRLAQLGHSVVLVEREPFPRPHVGESLVPAALPLLGVLGIRQAIEDAAFLRPRGTILQWAGATEYRRSSPDAGFQVDRGQFDAIVLDAARAAGVQILQPARAMPPVARGDEWRTAVSVDGGTTMVTSRLVADAAGRPGWLRRHRWVASPRTLAIYAYWRGVPLCGPETRVEAGDAHWYWGAPLPGGLFNVAVFVDRSVAAPALRAGGADRFYEHLVGRSSLLAGVLRGRRDSRVSVCDATPSHVETPAALDALCIGEAAFSIDPLSSQGVQSALGSSLHAAATAHTIIERPGDAALALAFYGQAQREACAFHADATKRAFREGLERWSGPFWQDRAGLARRSPGSQEADSSETSPEPRMTSTAQRWPELTTTVQSSDGVRVVPAPVVSHDFVVPGTRVLIPGMEHDLAFLGDVAIGPLLAGTQQPVSVERLLERWGACLGRDRAVATFESLWAHGVLRASDAPLLEQVAHVQVEANRVAPPAEARSDLQPAARATLLGPRRAAEAPAAVPVKMIW